MRGIGAYPAHDCDRDRLKTLSIDRPLERNKPQFHSSFLSTEKKNLIVVDSSSFSIEKKNLIVVDSSFSTEKKNLIIVDYIKMTGKFIFQKENLSEEIICREFIIIEYNCSNF